MNDVERSATRKHGAPASAGSTSHAMAERRQSRLKPALLVLLALASCGDQVQKAKPPERPAAPSTGNPHGGMPPGHPPLPSDHPAIGQGTATRSAPNPHADPFAEGDAGAKPAMGEAPKGDPKKIVVGGEISLDPSVKVGESYVVYVVAIFSPTERAPVYIKKYDAPKFPFRFEITEGDQGAAGGSQSGRPLYIRAMISDTGDAMNTRNRTVSDQAYAPGTSDAKLTIK